MQQVSVDNGLQGKKEKMRILRNNIKKPKVMEKKRMKFNAAWNAIWPVFLTPTLTCCIGTNAFSEKTFSADIIFLKFNIGFEILLKK